MYPSQIVKLANEKKVPPQLVINWDQTRVNIVSASSWTVMARPVLPKSGPPGPFLAAKIGPLKVYLPQMIPPCQK